MPNQAPPGLGPFPTFAPDLPPADPGPVLAPKPGVVFTPSDQISASAKRLVQQELDRIPAGKRGFMAKVTVETATGVNAAIAYKTASGWQTGLWAGKSGWDQVVGVSVGKIWD